MQIYDNYSESQKAFCEKNGRVPFCPPFGDFLSTNEKKLPRYFPRDGTFLEMNRGRLSYSRASEPTRTLSLFLHGNEPELEQAALGIHTVLRQGTSVWTPAVDAAYTSLNHIERQFGVLRLWNLW